MGWLENWLDKLFMGEEMQVMDLSLIEEKIPIDKHLEAGEKRIEEARKENKEEEKAEEGLKHVIDGAKLECQLCTNPVGDLKVNFDTPTIQDKKIATIKEKDMKSLVFKGNCKKSPYSNSPCASVMQLGEWKKTGTSLIQDQPPVLLQSTIKCNYGGVDIKITDCGQRCEPEEIDVVGAPVPVEEKEKKILSIYWTYGEEETKLNSTSKFYVDMDLHVKTINYKDGELITVTVNFKDGKSINEKEEKIELKGSVENNKIIFKNVLSQYTLELMNND